MANICSIRKVNFSLYRDTSTRRSSRANGRDTFGSLGVKSPISYRLSFYRYMARCPEPDTLESGRVNAVVAMPLVARRSLEPCQILCLMLEYS